MSKAPGSPAPLRVAIECSRLAHDARGIGRYVRAVMPRLLAQRAELHLVPFARREGEVDALRHVMAGLGLPASRVTVRPFARLGASDVDLWWYPWNVARPLPREGIVAVTMHDVAPLALPDPRTAKWWQNRRWRRLYERTARRAGLILTVSQFSANEIERNLGVPSARIRVVPLAADDIAVPATAGDAETLARLDVRPPFVLAVGADDRRKNLSLLDRAMTEVADLLPSVRLVVVGTPRRARGTEPEWHQSLGVVGDEDLASLYRSARAVIVPSLYEGFGLPVLEAMRLGTPVVCARTASLPEVAGGAALYVSAHDERQLALAIVQLVTNDALYESLRRAGHERATQFSWDETARLTLAAFDATLGR